MFSRKSSWGNSVCFCEKTRKRTTNIVAQSPQAQSEFLLSQWEWDVHSTPENQTVSLKMQNRASVTKWSPQVWEQKPGYLHGGVREGDKPAGALENSAGKGRRWERREGATRRLWHPAEVRTGTWLWRQIHSAAKEGCPFPLPNQNMNFKNTFWQ